MLRLRMLRSFLRAKFTDSICVVAMELYIFECVASATHFFVFGTEGDGANIF